jgi:hypothetical protein
MVACIPMVPGSLAAKGLTRGGTGNDFLGQVFMMRKDSVNVDEILDGLRTLTPREHDVLNQVVLGRLNKEIASELGITISHRQGTPSTRDGENGSQFSRGTGHDDCNRSTQATDLDHLALDRIRTALSTPSRMNCGK